MATVKRFEELVVWQMADLQRAAFYKLVEVGRFNGHGSLYEQMDRSSGSVMDNIAEGFDRFSKAEFRQFLIIARGSNAEFRSQLYRALRRSIIDEKEFEDLKRESEYLSIKIHHFIEYLSHTTYKHKAISATAYHRDSKEQEGQSNQEVSEYPESYETDWRSSILKAQKDLQ